MPVIYDTDMDFDDTMALAYLAGEANAGRIKLLAVTVETDGAGLPAIGAAHARCVLQRSGLGGTPVAQGSLPLNVNLVPPEVRAAAEGVVEPALVGCLPGLFPDDAPLLLAGEVVASPDPVTIITSGPLTDVAAALRYVAAQPGGLDHVSHVYSMLGAIGVPGAACCTTTALASGNQELNAWIDPAADESVLQILGSKWTLVPIDATNDVPVTAAALAALKSDHSTPDASIVASLASSPLFDLNSVEQPYFWDPLAAVVATTGEAVTFAASHLQFVTSGKDVGRTVVDPAGPLIDYAASADPQEFLRLFQAGLDER
jgi:inosine-uridine nucleoside N-ribohydrolase